MKYKVHKETVERILSTVSIDLEYSTKEFFMGI